MMKKTLLLILFILLVNSCKSGKNLRDVNAVLKKSNKRYLIITKEEADISYNHFSLIIPPKWRYYFDEYYKTIISPLGTSLKTHYFKGDSISTKKRAKKIVQFNKNKPWKKGFYLQSYLIASSISKDSINVNSNKDLIDWYLKTKYKVFRDAFKYEIIEEENPKFGKIIYFKYGLIVDSSNTKFLDAFVLSKKRIYMFQFQSKNQYYDFYFNDIINTIKSLTIKE